MEEIDERFFIEHHLIFGLQKIIESLQGKDNNERISKFYKFVGYRYNLLKFPHGGYGFSGKGINQDYRNELMLYLKMISSYSIGDVQLRAMLRTSADMHDWIEQRFKENNDNRLGILDPINQEGFIDILNNNGFIEVIDNLESQSNEMIKSLQERIDKLEKTNENLLEI